MPESESTQEAPLLGGHLALDLLNTLFTPHGDPVETLDSGRALLVWMTRAQLLDEPAAMRLVRQFGVKSFDAAAADVRRFREWCREWLSRWRLNPDPNGYHAEITTLNKHLDRARTSAQVSVHEDRCALVRHVVVDSPAAVLPVLSMHVANLICEADPTLVKSCAGDRCSLWFLDRTKAHRRMFCSASACGNRAKVAAFRQRQRIE